MKLTESPGYYVHTWNVKLRQTVDMGLVSVCSGFRREKIRESGS